MRVQLNWRTPKGLYRCQFGEFEELALDLPKKPIGAKLRNVEIGPQFGQLLGEAIACDGSCSLNARCKGKHVMVSDVKND